MSPVQLKKALDNAAVGNVGDVEEAEFEEMEDEDGE